MKFIVFILKVAIIATFIYDVLSLKRRSKSKVKLSECIEKGGQCERTYDNSKNFCCEPMACVNWKYDEKIKGWGYFNDKNKILGTCQILVKRKIKKK